MPQNREIRSDIDHRSQLGPPIWSVSLFTLEQFIGYIKTTDMLEQHCFGHINNFKPQPPTVRLNN